MKKVLIVVSMLMGSLIAQSPQTIRMSGPVPSPPTNVSASVVKGGQGTYYYWIVANYPIGKVITADATIAFKGPDTYSSSSHVLVGWTAVTGATSYDVLRTTTAGLPSGTTNSSVATGLTVTSFNDTIVSPSSYTLSPLASTFNGAISIDNTNASIAMLLWSLPQVTNFPVKTITFSDGTTQTTAGGGGGGGAVTITTGAANPVAACAAPTALAMAVYYQTTSKTVWTCTDTNTWKLNVIVDPAAAFLITGNTGTAPATPSAGTLNIYADSTTKVLTAKNENGLISQTVFVVSGTTALATGAISNGVCVTATTAATGVVSTDAISWNPNASIKAVTGYVPGTSGGLSIVAFPTSGNVNFDVCNWSSAPITPGAVTLNWSVKR